jgi:hypothetical protein
MNGAEMNDAAMNSEHDAIHPAEWQRTVRSYNGLGEERSVNKRDLRDSNVVSGRSASCTAERCASSGVCLLELQPFCLHHFITCCFERLRLCSLSWCLYPHSAATASYDAFIRECIMTTAKLLQEGTGIDAVRRSHLVDVFLWASELAVKRTLSASAEPMSSHAAPESNATR